MKHLIILYLLVSSFALTNPQMFAQDSIFVDPRDGQMYELLQLGSANWFASNLKYVTETSWCFDPENQADCEFGNYYYNHELDRLCPTGWHVASWEDWERARPYIANSLGVNYDSMQKDTAVNGAIYVYGINLINDSLGVRLHPTGWIQGKKKVKRYAADIWAGDSLDDRSHLHIGEGRYLIHAHDENINDKPKRLRRFQVRCVKNE